MLLHCKVWGKRVNVIVPDIKLFFYCFSSAEQVSEKQNSTARKRRRNQNVEIDELGELLPFKPDRGKNLDKLSILRLTTSYIKFQNFMTAGQQSVHDILRLGHSLLSYTTIQNTRACVTF